VKKEQLLESKLRWGWISAGILLGAMFMELGTLQNFEWTPLILVFGGWISSSVNLHIYYNQPEWYFRYYAKQVQKETHKEVIFE